MLRIWQSSLLLPYLHQPNSNIAYLTSVRKGELGVHIRYNMPDVNRSVLSFHVLFQGYLAIYKVGGCSVWHLPVPLKHLKL